MERYSQINDFLFSSSFFYTIAIGMDSTYTYVSPNYDRNFSFGKGSLKGQHFSVTLHPEDVAMCGEVGARCFSAPDKLFPVTLRKHDGDGGYVVTQWEMRAVLDEEGVPVGIFCMGYNITKFIQAQEKLDRAETQLDEIGFMQSHGVRRPLANIMGIAELFNHVDKPEDYKPLLRMLNESAKELDNIIHEINRKTDSL